MSKETTKTEGGNRPSYELFVVKGEGEKAYWTKIGAAWPTEKGRGFMLDFVAVPVASGRVVMLEAEREAKAA